MSVVGWPPILRSRHHIDEVCLQSINVQLRERFGIVKAGAQWIGRRVVVAKRIEVQPVGPPVVVVGDTVLSNRRANRGKCRQAKRDRRGENERFLKHTRCLH